MNRKVFFSYSWLDMAVANRLYGDLVRSGLNVWRDQIDGDPTADFLAEFLQRIDECDDFLILDSSNYRKRSNWCLTEIERFLQKKEDRDDCNLIVCLLEEEGDWRKEFRSKRHEELFSKINYYKYHKLFYNGTYDNENVYQKSLAEICKLFSKRYVPWNVLPSDRDLSDELSDVDVHIDREDRELILKGYEYISRMIELQKNCREHFQLWISDCKAFGLNLFFPRWTYCVWLGHEAHQGRLLEECRIEFKRLAEDFPKDPRSFRGLGCVTSQLGCYEESLNALKEALRLMGQPSQEWHDMHSRFEVLSNMGQVLINMNEREKSLDYLEEAISIMESQEGFEVQVVKNYIESLFAMHQIYKCKKTLAVLLAKYPGECELYRELGKLYANEEQNEKALSLFESAHQLSSSIEDVFYIMCRKDALGRLTSEELKNALNLQEVQNMDNYWKGAICYYLLKDEEKASFYYNKLKHKDDFPWYQR